jgi:hypothetical protein
MYEVRQYNSLQIRCTSYNPDLSKLADKKYHLFTL